MADQPRWPRGTPVGPSGKGPGGGRFRPGIGPPGSPGWRSFDSWAEIDGWIETEFGHDADPTGRHGAIERWVWRPATGSDGPAVFRRRDYTNPYSPRDTDPEPIAHVYRAMSLEEWNEATERGFIQSDMRGVLADWEGTNAEVSPRGAMHYLPNGGAGVIVKLRVELEDRWFTRAEDEYLRTRVPVLLDRVERVAGPIGKDQRGAYQIWDPDRQTSERWVEQVSARLGGDTTTTREQRLTDTLSYRDEAAGYSTSVDHIYAGRRIAGEFADASGEFRGWWSVWLESGDQVSVRYELQDDWRWIEQPWMRRFEQILAAEGLEVRGWELG